MSLPIVAVVGRPNVGKSTLFNKLIGQRLSIVEDTPGVTRDRIYSKCEWRGREFMIVDTGGIEPDSDDVILAQMRRQSELAIEKADVIVFVTDLRCGVTSDDYAVADILMKSGKPVVLAVNKCDNLGEPPMELYEFYNLGLGEPFPISSVHGHGTGDMLDEVFNYLPETVEEQYDEFGKFVFIDTAGIRKKSKITEKIEHYSVLRAYMAVDRADVCVIMLDATEGFTEQDSKVAGYAHEQGKACVVAVNKWDLIEKNDKTMQEFRTKLENDFSFMSYVPFVFISAKTGQRINKLYELIKYTYEQNSMRISTGMLNDVLAYATTRVQPPSDKGRRLKIYYMTQPSTKPPTFVTFVNRADLFHFSYRRYIENQIRSAFGLEGTPVRFIVRERGGSDK